jgi:ribosomal protein L23
MDKQLALKPRLSEKTYGLSEKRNVFTFDVPAGTNKHTVARAVAAQYEVTVTGVRIANIAGKAKRTISQKGKLVGNGRTIAIKKAYVTLKVGDNIPIFKGVKEAEEKQQAIQEKFTKAIEKKAKKETKPTRGGLRRFVNRRGEV